METAHFNVRPLTREDADGTFREWFANPKIMHPMNLPARELKREALAEYIEGFDGQTRLLLGIFDKSNGAFSGFWMVEINGPQRVATIYLAIDRANALAPLIALETVVPLGDLLLKSGIEKAVGHIIGSNQRAVELVETVGMKLEGVLREEVVDLTGGGGRVDLSRFALLRSEYAAFRERVQMLIGNLNI
jgi:RimJ/RimL family protein N-acetyltransferase